MCNIFYVMLEQVAQRAIEASMALTIVEALNKENTSEIKNMADSKFDFKSLQVS